MRSFNLNLCQNQTWDSGDLEPESGHFGRLWETLVLWDLWAKEAAVPIQVPGRNENDCKGSDAHDPRARVNLSPAWLRRTRLQRVAELGSASQAGMDHERQSSPKRRPFSGSWSPKRKPSRPLHATGMLTCKIM